jgi:carbamoylphosphate synthase small subunit
MEVIKSNAEVVLDDGSRFEGISFGADISVSGEAVFQTGRFLVFSFSLL